MLYNFVFTECPFKTVSGDVTAFHRMADIVATQLKNRQSRDGNSPYKMLASARQTCYRGLLSIFGYDVYAH